MCRCDVVRGLPCNRNYVLSLGQEATAASTRGSIRCGANYSKIANWTFDGFAGTKSEEEAQERHSKELCSSEGSSGKLGKLLTCLPGKVVSRLLVGWSV